MPATVWDPCCGNGDIAIVLQRRCREVVSTDLIDRGCGQGGLDFLLQRTALARAIVTNPPFKRAEAFLRHAAELGIEYVAFLHKAHWLNAADESARPGGAALRRCGPSLFIGEPAKRQERKVLENRRIYLCCRSSTTKCCRPRRVGVVIPVAKCCRPRRVHRRCLRRKGSTVTSGARRPWRVTVTSPRVSR